jgi:hypothetical protein
MVFATSITVVAGVLLYWRASDGLDLTWISSPVGSASPRRVAAIMRLLMGMTLISPTLERLDRLGARSIASGGHADAEQGWPSCRPSTGAWAGPALPTSCC